jgi:hypothetical protein
MLPKPNAPTLVVAFVAALLAAATAESAGSAAANGRGQATLPYESLRLNPSDPRNLWLVLDCWAASYGQANFCMWWPSSGTKTLPSRSTATPVGALNCPF